MSQKMSRNSATSLANTFNEMGRLGLWLTDKGTSHNYIDTYGSMLDKIQHKPVTICEIGVYSGASILLWDKYFTHPDTVIYGVDHRLDLIVSECSSKYSSRVRIIEADILSAEQLLIEQKKPHFDSSFNHVKSIEENEELNNTTFDFVVDDGTHYLKWWFQTFKYFVPKLKPGGIFCIEDIFPPEHVQDLVDLYSRTQVFDCREGHQPSSQIVAFYA